MEAIYGVLPKIESLRFEGKTAPTISDPGTEVKEVRLEGLVFLVEIARRWEGTTRRGMARAILELKILDSKVSARAV